MPPPVAPPQSLMPDFENFISQSSVSPSPPSGAQPAPQSLMPDFEKFVSQAAPSSPASSSPQAPFRGAAIDTSQAVPQALGRIGSAIGQGASDAFGSAPLGISPQTTAALQKIGIEPPTGGNGTPMQDINQAAINTVGPWADLAQRSLGAAFSGAQAGVAQTGAELGQPELGRDVAALPEAFAGDASLMPGKPEVVAPKEPPVQLSQLTDAINNVGPSTPFTRNAAERSSGAVGAPQSLGAAATPARLTAISPRESAALEASDNQRRLTQGPIPGDGTIYVPGSTPTEADKAGNAMTSLEEKQYRDVLYPDEFKDKDIVNNEAESNFFKDMAGNPTIVNTAEMDRENQGDKDLTQAWKNKTPVDAAPLQDFAQSILASPAGKQKAVVTAMNNVISGLKDANGNLETDPEMLYGVRKDIGDMLSKTPTAANQGLSLAKSQLMDFRQALDGTIESGAPGFKQYLQNYAANSRPIDEMNYLQQWQNKIINSSGNMQTPQIHKMMQDITKQRAMPGVNDAKSISPDTLSKLWDLHANAIRRNNRTLGKAAGSDTYQNFSLGSQLAGHGAHLTAHMIGAHIAPGFGNMAVEAGKGLINKASSAKLKKAQDVRKNQLLNPNGGL